jgi:hypothetical protein
MTPSGNDLVFSSWGQLTPDDTDQTRDIFRFDFLSGELTRISKGRNGNDGNGNNDEFPAELPGSPGGFADVNVMAEEGTRVISADGSRVIFRTAGPLVSQDTDTGEYPDCNDFEIENQPSVQGTGCDIYLWEEQGRGTCEEAGGCIRLISSGKETRGDKEAVISSSGDSIAFHTRRNMIPEDQDGIGDIYVAKVDGGFHNPVAPAECGSPEGCRSSAQGEPSPPTLGTPNFIGRGNAAPHLKCARGKRRVIRHGQVRCVKKRKGHHKKKHRKRRHHKRRHLRAASNRGGRK